LSSLLLRDEAGRPAGSVGLARRVSPPWQLLPALGAALLLVFSGILSAAVFWARWRRQIRSLLRLIETSEQMSLGKLHSRVETGSNGEMRILAESLERLRISLKTALGKLRQRSQ
jgi:HAMP domain-containing protein